MREIGGELNQFAYITGESVGALDNLPRTL